MPTHKSSDYKLSAIKYYYLILKTKYKPVKYSVVQQEV